LALGIGANAAIFSVVRGILLRPLPFAEPDRIMMVAATYAGSRPGHVSPANAYDWRAQNKSFSSMAVLTGHSVVITGAGDPEQLHGFDVGGDFFSVLGIKAIRGSAVFTPEDTTFNGSKAVMISETLWRTRFGSDSAMVGKMITLDNERYRVAGIIPADAAWPTNTAIWFPFTVDPAKLEDTRSFVYLSVVARLKPAASVTTAIADMRTISGRLEHLHPDNDSGVSATVVPLREWITGSLKLPLLMLLGGVGFVLLIACANVANLLLVRGVARDGEIAVRTALGAGRGRLVRQLVTESMVLSLLGGAAGLALAIAGTRLLVAAAPASIPRLGSIHVDGLVLVFTVVVATITGLLFGLVPARQMLHPNLAQTLREGGRSGAKRAGHGVRRVLVVAQVALSVMLLAGAGLLIRSFDSLMAVDPGFRTDNSISFALSLPDAKYHTAGQRAVFMRSMMDRMHALPGVQSAGAAYGMPLTNFGFDLNFMITGRPPLRPQDLPDAEVRVATPDYFPTMGIKIVKGRGFTAQDRAASSKVLLVTQTAAKKFFPGEDPIGRHVAFVTDPASGPFEGDIVGIVADVKQLSLATATLPQFWAPYDQWPMPDVNVVLHTSHDPRAIVAGARRILNELDPQLAMAQIKTLDAIVAESVAQPHFYMILLTAFAIVAIALCAIGIYGVVAYLVGQRSRELGIRIALGATPSRVVQLVVREGVAMVAAGIGVGLIGALAITRLMGALLFNVRPTDPLTYIAVTALLSAVGLFASSVPAMRAANVDPAHALRSD
ncbi:MAG TPA: ABC transporter permease, partial [Gemmatimonadaceae bacterium]